MDVGVKKTASFPNSSKSGKRAEEWKKQGKSHFRRRELSEALQCYAEVEDQSLCTCSYATTFFAGSICITLAWWRKTENPISPAQMCGATKETCCH